MDAASFWVEVEELEAGKLGLIKSNAESKSDCVRYKG